MDLTQNYFEIFGLPVDFSVDQARLSSRYLTLQKHLHPDNFIASTDQEKRLSMQWSTLVNTAQATLKDPLKCAIYILQLHQIDIAENPSLPADFLMHQIALREELEAIENGSEENDSEGNNSAGNDLEKNDLEGKPENNNSAGKPEKMQQITSFKNNLASVTQSLETDFVTALQDDPQDAAAVVYKLQFIYKLRLKAEQLEEKLLGY